jgi:hypothetical protein
MKKIAIGCVAALLVAIAALFSWRGYMIHELKKPILAQMKDPESARFQNVEYLGPWSIEEGTLCGEVNMKNAMGGYVGYTRFHSAYGGSVALIGGDDKMQDIMCKDFKDDIPWWWLKF